MGFRGLKTKNLFRIQPWNGGWGLWRPPPPLTLQRWKWVQHPWHFGFNRPLCRQKMGIWQSDLQENMHTDGVCRSSPRLARKISPIPTLTPITRLLDGHKYIINSIARGALHVCFPPQAWPLMRNECCGRGAPAKVACTECTWMCTVEKEFWCLNI